MSEPVARATLLQAMTEGRCAELLDCLFNGGTCTVDPVERKLILIPGSALLAAFGEDDPELEAIARDLDIDTEPWAVSCPWNCSGEADGSGHDAGCPWRRLREWVAARPAPAEETTSG